jgi:aflatoxin B1 aldehyde reductase
LSVREVQEGKNGVRTPTVPDSQQMFDTFFSYGHKELDTARRYAEGTTKKVIPRSRSPILSI